MVAYTSVQGPYKKNLGTVILFPKMDIMHTTGMAAVDVVTIPERTY